MTIMRAESILTGGGVKNSHANPFGADLASGRRVEEGDYSDCDNESEDEDDSDDEAEAPGMPANPFDTSAAQLE